MSTNESAFPSSTTNLAQGEPTSAQLQPAESNGHSQIVVNPKVVDAESIKTRPYPFDLDPVVVMLKEDGNDYLHVMKKPAFEHDERRERMSQVTRRTLGNIDAQDDDGNTVKVAQSKSSGDDLKAATRYYNDLVLTVSGYDLNGAVVEDLDPRTVHLGTDASPLTALDVIPPAHKLFVANNMYGGDFEVEKASRFSLGSGREWRITHRIGQRSLGDGSKSAPLFEIVYIFGEPTDELVSKFRQHALNTIDVDGVNGNESERRRTINLNGLCEIFDAGVRRIEGGTVADEQINVRDDRQLALIAPKFKKDSMLVFYGRILQDLGN